MRSTVLSLVAASAIGVPASAQVPPPNAEAKLAEVLVLGTYHMANPGRDIFSMRADDVLTAKRQGEIAQVIAVLKKFQPTKIALEADVYSDRVPKTYADYLAGKRKLTRNEIEQLISIRKLGHQRPPLPSPVVHLQRRSASFRARRIRG